MLRAVRPDRSPGVHDEFRAVTVEVDDEAVEWTLPPELRVMKARAAQAPKGFLWARRMLAESSENEKPRSFRSGAHSFD
jgi:hypothetical protein